MEKITKLHDKYSLYSKYGDFPCDREPMTLEGALAMVRGNEHLASGERHCVYIVDNETDKMETAYTEEEFIDKCPEFWLYYEVHGHDYTLEDNLMVALGFQADVLMHEWNTGACYCANYFIGDIVRYAFMNNGHSILRDAEEIMKGLNDSAKSQIEHYKAVERIGQIVEVVEQMGLQVPRSYKYKEALLFEYAKEKTNALRKLHNLKNSLLETYRKVCTVERNILDIYNCGEKEFSEALKAQTEQYSKLMEAEEMAMLAMDSREKFCAI